NGPERSTVVTDENLNPTTLAWSSFGDPDEARLVTLTDPEVGLPWQYQYNALGNLTVVAPPGVSLDDPARTRRFVYNPKNQLQSESHPEADAPTTYTYDAVGNVHSRTDAEFGQTTFTYDGNNRLRFTTAGDAYDTETRYDEVDHRYFVR